MLNVVPWMSMKRIKLRTVFQEGPMSLEWSQHPLTQHQRALKASDTN